VNLRPRRAVGVAAVLLLAYLAVLAQGPVAPASAVTPEARAYALVEAMIHTEQSMLAASRPVARCTRKGHRRCLPAAARELARVAEAEQAPIRKATKIQQTCGRRAGQRYLKALRLWHEAGLALARAKGAGALRSAAKTVAAADRLEGSAVKKAQACWRSTVR
jgi:uncharacterized protein YukE